LTFSEIWTLPRLQFLDNGTKTQVALKAMRFIKENPKGSVPFEEIIAKVRKDDRQDIPGDSH
jgi:hypothetical protein